MRVMLYTPPQVYMSKDWHEQAALMHLTQDSTVEAHYHYVKQRTINAYPDSVECSDEGGPYQVSCWLCAYTAGWPRGAILQWVSDKLLSCDVDPYHTRLSNA
jgi:hypothetical protein